MKYLILIISLFIYCNVSFGQESISTDNGNRKNAIYIELAGRGYFSLNYDKGWEKNRANFGIGWNDMETYLTPEEAIEKDVVGDHETSPYLLLNLQYSRLIGTNTSFLELGFGAVITAYDMERNEIANNLYDNQSYLSIYPLIGYRYEGRKGLFFLVSFNPLIELRQGSFWPIPGISLGYKF